MPAYEYLCDSCEIHFDIRQKMSDPALDTCPECGGHVRRLISGGAGAITKGSQSSSGYANQSACGFGGSCCAQGDVCCGKAACEQ